MLRSILAQLEYRYQVCEWDNAGVPFRTYLYVPEKHPITGSEFHEREDFAHVLKVQFNYRIMILKVACTCIYFICREWLKVQDWAALGILN